MPKNTEGQQGKRESLSRRDFIRGASLVAGGLAIGSVIPATPEVFLFFNSVEAAAIKAAFGRLIPGDTQDPGAIEAKAYIYIDRALTGYYQSLQQSYKRGIAAMNAYAESQYSASFSQLTASQQDSVLNDMQADTATGFYAPGASQFFGMLLKHVGEGMFCDPAYGGNQDLAGWKLIGYPGAQHTYSNSDMAIGTDQANKEIMTLADIESMAMPLPDSGF